MPLQTNDLFVVQRGNSLFKVPSSTLKDDYGSTAQVHIGENPPPGDPVQGDLWWSTLEGNLFIWYNDGDSKQWVDASPAFIEIDYERIEDYLDQSVLDNAVAQIKSDGIITVDPSGGKGVVTIGADTSIIEGNISDLDSKLDQEIIDRQTGDKNLQDQIDAIDYVTPADFLADQQRQDDEIALRVTITDFETDQQRQDDEIQRLENIIKDLADRLDQLEDDVAGVNSIDGGYPNAEGVFDEPDTDGGAADPNSLTDTPIEGGDAEGYD